MDGASGQVVGEPSKVWSLFVVGGLIGGAVGEPVFVNDLGGTIGRGVTNARKSSGGQAPG